MGGNAWLDSLSEDWVSQHGSDTSFQDPNPNPTSKANAKTGHDATTQSPPKTAVSRIPRLNNGAKKPQAAGAIDDFNSSNVLSERSVNELVGAGSRRTPSKLSQEIKFHDRRYSSRSVSAASTSGSVVHNIVHHKSLSTSPTKGQRDTPEWKRRLVDGDLSFGEQRDLFTSAGAVLENIFKPPPPQPSAAHRGHGSAQEESYEHHEAARPSQYDVTLPSSPPPYLRDPSTVEIHVDESGHELPQQAERRAPTSMRYRRTDESFEASGDSDLSAPPPESYSQDVSPTEQTAPSPPRHDALETESRKASGRSVVRNEDFSPILIERRQASNGKEMFGAADLRPDELRKRLEKLRRNQMLLTTDPDALDGPSGAGNNVETTEDFERLGGFINFRRGGRSADGSFRNHGLSSAMNDTSELLPEESLQASTPKQFPSVRTQRWEETEALPADSPDIPRVPNPSPEKKTVTQTQGTSGSPLKLFQPYDTFTNQTLLRRLSQFQEGAEDDTPSFPKQEELERPLSLGQGQASRRAADQTWIDGQGDEVRTSSASLNQFGAGRLDGYEFSDEFSYVSNGVSALDGDKENRHPDGDSEQMAAHAPIFDVSHDSSPSEIDDLVVRKLRQKSTSVSSRYSMRGISVDEARRSVKDSCSNGAEVQSTPKQRDSGSDIKRPRTSPSKDPTPKRRRTLHKSDVAYEAMVDARAVDSVQLSHQQMQSIIGRKRKDARHGDQLEFADADVLAVRQLLRPRTPTPGQRPSLQWDRPPLADIEKSPGRSARHAQPSAPMPLGSVLDADRKPSIKTEDFINEANKIMAMIRSKAGLASGLASVEESDAENGQPQLSPDSDTSYQESTQEPFSRPPSREGRAPVARMSARQEDPELAERLKKYEEASDMGDIISSSMRSVALGQGTLDSISTRPSIFDDDVISDPPNIRISQNPDLQERQFANDGNGLPSHVSSGSSSQSTGRSIPTGSSRGSDTRKTIAPETVQHLIPDQVGNMVLDKQRNIWIKRKPPKPAVSTASSGNRRTNFLPSEASEDDPFADIPDLTVDMTIEMQNLRLATAKKQQASHDDPAEAASPTSPSRPSNSAPMSKSALLEAYASSPPSPPRPGPSRVANQPVTNANAKIDDDSVEHEIKIDEGRASIPKRRNMTISFSSPVASFIQDAQEEGEAAADEPSVLEQADDASKDFTWDSMKRGRRVVSVHTSARNSSSRSRSTSRGPARHLSVRGHTFVPRPISRIDELEEESVLDRVWNRTPAPNMELSIVADSSVVSHDADGGHQASLSFVVTTPARRRDCSLAGVDAAPIISQYVGTLSLSPISEFTMHQGEETMPLEASYIVGNHHLVTGDQSRRVMSMNTRDLVDKLAEVEPFEPYWDDMRELDLRDKRLGSLHALDEFCDHLESLDVSNNDIRNLVGVPSTVRHLKMVHNQLSSLTSWGHLMNLQYVDISNNGLTSLSAFRDLVHLRSLKVDNNLITSLEGIKFHSGLQTLRARGNAIEELDLDGNKLHQLMELDLKNNAIKRIANLEQLPGLSSLNLEGNLLESFAIESEKPLVSLRHLRLDDNRISVLDIKLLPHLRLLHADRNFISRIAGFSRARRIDSLSLREQQGGADESTPALDVAYLLSRAYEVRKLYLSGNFLGAEDGPSSFAPAVDFLNLQLLELANCGLQTLPADLGLMMPNLRVLNLNLNALADLAPLRCIPRLKRLFTSGNRLADAAALVDTLAAFPHLVAVDVRDNPVTQGFYVPAQMMAVARRAAEESGSSDGAASASASASASTTSAVAAEDDPSGGRFALPDQDPARDRAYASRLDLATRIRRRLYEHLFCAACRRVKRLDGLDLRRGDVAGCRDAVWAALAEQGLVRAGAQEGEAEAEGKDGAVLCGEHRGSIKKNDAVLPDESARWQAEDSFA